MPLVSGGRRLTANWTFFRQTYQQKGEDPSQYNYRFILLSYFQFRSKERDNPDALGNVWYDDIMVVPAVPEWTLNQVHPSHESVTVNGGKVVFSSFFEHGFIPHGAEVEVLSTLKYVGSSGEISTVSSLKDGFITTLANTLTKTVSFETFINIGDCYE